MTCQQEMRMLGVVLERRMVSVLDELARAYGLSRSALLRVIIRAWLDGNYQILKSLREEDASAVPRSPISGEKKD